MNFEAMPGPSADDERDYGCEESVEVEEEEQRPEYDVVRCKSTGIS